MPIPCEDLARDFDRKQGGASLNVPTILRPVVQACELQGCQAHNEPDSVFVGFHF
jgi:hypothetical protein